MPKTTLRAALIAGAAIVAILAGTIPLIMPALAQDNTQTETPPAEGTQTPAPAPDAQAPAATPETQAPAAATTETKPDPNQVVARVNGTDVTRQEVLDSAADLPE
jgi:peptidyl-prolyl cis-trans isomerase C